MIVAVVQATWLLPAFGSLVIVTVAEAAWLLPAFGFLVIVEAFEAERGPEQT